MAADLRALIVDDEPLAVERLQILCAQTEGVALVGTATDGEAALRMVEALSPDLLLLDIAMPGMSGIEVAAAIEKMAVRPAVIFCTAFDHFAVAAFDVAAVDYLLKPVTPERLAKAIGRVREKASDAAETPAESQWTEEFWISHRAEMVRVAAIDIDRIEAERDYMRLWMGQRSFLLHQTISELERRLDPEKFIRLHRSTIVRRDFIAKLKHDGLGVWHAVLNDGAEVRIGRTYHAAAREMMGR
jgi:two-component system, LytTR family, response regulator AlgR